MPISSSFSRPVHPICLQPLLPEALEKRAVSSRIRHQPRGVKRKMSSYPLRRRGKSKVATQMRKISYRDR
jgi:hypothetical protein